MVGKHQKKIVSKLLRLGVGIAGATEFIYKVAEQLLARNTPQSDPLCLLPLDFSNAFNRLNRFEMRREVRCRAPEISPWVEYPYAVSAQLIVDHNNNLLSKGGVQQGAPLAPLLFSIGADPLVKLVSAIPGIIWSPWYLDDGSIVAPVSVIPDALNAVTTHGPAYGLHLNLGKCSITGHGISQALLQRYGVPNVPIHSWLKVKVPVSWATPWEPRIL